MCICSNAGIFAPFISLTILFHNPAQPENGTTFSIADNPFEWDSSYNIVIYGSNSLHMAIEGEKSTATINTPTCHKLNTVGSKLCRKLLTVCCAVAHMRSETKPNISCQTTTFSHDSSMSSSVATGECPIYSSCNRKQLLFHQSVVGRTGRRARLLPSDHSVEARPLLCIQKYNGRMLSFQCLVFSGRDMTICHLIILSRRVLVIAYRPMIIAFVSFFLWPQASQLD